MNNKVKVLYTSNLSNEDALDFSTASAEIDIKPFIKVNCTFDKKKLLEFASNYNPECVVITSQKALKGLFTLGKLNIQNLSLMALSENIADKIKGDFKSVIVAENGNTESVAKKVKEQFGDSRLLHLTGNLRKDQLKKLLIKDGIAAENYQVYATELIQPEIDMSEYSAVAFLSYSGIDSFFSKYELKKDIPAFSIGPNTSDYLRKYYNGQIFTSSEASVRTLLKEINEYFSND